MEQVMTSPAESEALIETPTTGQRPRLVWWDLDIVQSPNGDHPEVTSTVSIQESDENDSWEPEGKA